jgi:hypothetical protein
MKTRTKERRTDRATEAKIEAAFSRLRGLGRTAAEDYLHSSGISRYVIQNLMERYPSRMRSHRHERRRSLTY